MVTIVFLVIGNCPAYAATPAFISLAPSVQDFGRFADGGPDGSWYVGFNNAWIVELPPVPSGDYARAFIGAKLGRAKTRPKSTRSWEREVIPGKVYIALSQTPAFSSEQSFFLAEAADLPLEPDSKTYVKGTGQSEWFWAEVPVGSVNRASSNYLIVWSPTESFLDSATSPIIAAAEPRVADRGPAHAWVNRSIQGVPPRREENSLGTPINNLYPALAVKLVPANTGSVAVSDCSLRSVNQHFIFGFSVTAQDVDIAWLEVSQDQLDWQRTSTFLRRPPYLFNLSRETAAAGGYVRAVARDSFGNQGNCSPISFPPVQ